MKKICFALILSGISIAGVAADMSGMDMKGMEQPGNKAQTYRTTGVVKALDPSGKRVTIAHQPVEALGWPAMTMTFSVKDRKLIKKLHPEEKIKFEFVKHGSGYLITGVN